MIDRITARVGEHELLEPLMSVMEYSLHAAKIEEDLLAAEDRCDIQLSSFAPGQQAENFAFDVIGFESRGALAKSNLTKALNLLSGRAPGHAWQSLLNQVEALIYKSHERILKNYGRVKYKEQIIIKISKNEASTVRSSASK